MRKVRCKECHELKSRLPFIFRYLNKEMKVTTERKTCYQCWNKITKTRELKILSSGPKIIRNKISYDLVTILGEVKKRRREIQQ